MEAYDPNLTLTYVGGCPSRCCYPKGYGHRTGNEIVKNVAGFAYDGTRIMKTKATSPPYTTYHLGSLMMAIEGRKK